MTIKHFTGAMARAEEEVVLPVFSINGKDVNIAPLQTINFVKLCNNDPVQSRKLSQAVEYPGFFYLELPDSQLKELSVLNILAHEYLNHPLGTVKTRFLQIQAGGQLPAKLQSNESALDGSLKITEAISDALLRRLNLTSRTSSNLTMISASGAAVVPSVKPSILTFVLPESKQMACTTEIHLPATGFEVERSWAYVVPKHRCVLVGLSGAKYRIADPLNDDKERIWVQYEVC